MTELRNVIAKNICELRVGAGMTQLALAEMLNYSDKAVSKWERGESVPDIFMLKRIADYFGVSVDYLLESDHTASAEGEKTDRHSAVRNRFIVSFLATTLVWFVATLAFVSLLIIIPDLPVRPWLMFIYAIPTSSIVALVFNTIWGRRRMNYPIISILIWSALLSAFMTLLIVFGINVWPIFLLGIPGQAIVVIWSGMTGKHTKKEKAVSAK